jgi:hypothetical protein
VGLFNGIWLAVLGILGAAGLIIAKRPDAKDMIDKLVPFQGWIGAVSALVGVWWIIQAVLNIGWLSIVPIFWITFAASAVLQFALGMLLGIGVLKTFIKNPEANKRMDQTVSKLMPYQTKFGIAAIAVGVWTVVATFMFHV